MSTQTITNDNFKDTIDKEGIVLLNGEPCAQRGKKLYPGDQVTVEDHQLLVD